MTTMTVEQVAQQISQEVTGGKEVRPRPQVRVEARGITLEYDDEPYPEVHSAFAAFRRLAHVEAALVSYSVRPAQEDDGVRARVTANVAVKGHTYFGHGVDNDVVAGSVRAFAAAVDQVATAA